MTTRTSSLCVHITRAFTRNLRSAALTAGCTAGIFILLSTETCLAADAKLEEELRKASFAVSALTAPTVIQLDHFDVPTIKANSLLDAVCAEGWIHARDRFLQMDLARREAAGELAEVVPGGIAMDRTVRPLGLRGVAERAFALLPEHHRVLLTRYADGVNAQLSSTTPLEYKLLRVSPAPWRPEDALLVQLGMGRYLDRSPQLDRDRSTLFDVFPESVARFLSSSSGSLSASVDGSELPAPLPLPTALELDLRAQGSAASPAASNTADRVTPGSNAFAIAGSRTRDGRAIVGNDMHLALMAPGVWYRVRLEWRSETDALHAQQPAQDQASTLHEVTGLSLPGVPLIVQGTNGYVAWGFTNLTADLADLVVVERDPNDENRYLTSHGSEPFVKTIVEIGRESERERLDLLSTRFGPIVRTRTDGALIALRWAPLLDAHSVDCGLFDLAFATTLERALEVARAWNGPPQNVLVADTRGRIGWTIAGALPDRASATPQYVSSQNLPDWRGTLAPDAKPIIVDPPTGILVSANQLSHAPVGALQHIVGHDEVAGDRAHRMRTILESRNDWTESELFQVQLDTHSARLLRWRDALLALVALDSEVTQPTAVRETAEVLRTWNGFVTIDATAPVLLDAARDAVTRHMANALASLPSATESGVAASQLAIALEDEALLRILEAHPKHLLPNTASSWPAFAVRILAEAASSSREADGAFRTRGAVNRASIRHPAADALGAAARMAEMPKTQLPGHPTSVRVQTPRFGASQRSVVSPGHLDDAIMVTPCGQSGLPTSPHFRSLHKTWQDGETFPLLPAKVETELTLLPSLPVTPENTATDPLNQSSR